MRGVKEKRLGVSIVRHTDIVNDKGKNGKKANNGDAPAPPPLFLISLHYYACLPI
jgi:hypothetical protein